MRKPKKEHIITVKVTAPRFMTRGQVIREVFTRVNELAQYYDYIVDADGNWRDVTEKGVRITRAPKQGPRALSPADGLRWPEDGSPREEASITRAGLTACGRTRLTMERLPCSRDRCLPNTGDTMTDHQIVTGLVYATALSLGLGGVIALNIATNAAGRLLDALLAQIERSIKRHER